LCIVCDTPVTQKADAFRASHTLSPGIGYRVHLCEPCAELARTTRAGAPKKTSHESR
jgi:hypothetical protein